MVGALAGAVAADPTTIYMTWDKMELPTVDGIAATEVNSAHPGVDTLIGVEFKGIHGSQSTQYWAHIEAQGAIDTLDGSVPRLNIEFTPFSWKDADSVLPLAAEVRWLPISVGRDTLINRDFEVSVKALKASGGLYLPADRPGQLEIIAAIAVEALGARVINYANDAGLFTGAYLGGVGAEVGLGEKLSRHFTATVSIGGGVDVSVGHSQGFSFLVESKAYSEIKLKYDDFFSIFVKAQYRRSTDSGETGGNAAVSVDELIAGLSFAFGK